MDEIDEAFESRFDASGSWSTPPQPIDTALHHKEVETEIFACLDAAPLRQTLVFIEDLDLRGFSGQAQRPRHGTRCRPLRHVAELADRTRHRRAR